MKQFLCVLVLLWALAAPAWAQAAAAPPAVTAHSYLVMDAETGQTLIEQNGMAKNYPASITKIMTIALAMQHCGGDMTQQVTVSYEAVHALEYGSSHVALQPGEVVTLDDLFHATILASANDAANVLAEYTSGSMEAFVEEMNRQAAALGMTGTHFVNANGLHDDAHYTTAHDMAVLTRWALTVPGFAELFGATEYTMPATNMQEVERFWGTDNCMLVENKYQYEGTTGGKSGWTNEAGYTMVETAARDGRTLICVVLGSAKKYDKFADCIALLDYCFSSFQPVTVAADGLQPPPVTLYYSEDAPALGSAAVRPAAESYTVWLHEGLSAGDVRALYDVPETALTNEPFSGTMTLALTDEAAARGCMYATLGTFPLALDEASLQALYEANEKEFVDRGRAPSGTVTASNLVGTAIGVLMLAVTVFCIRAAWAAALRAGRRRRRILQQNAARAPYRAHTMQPQSPDVRRPAAHMRQKNLPRRTARYVPAHARQKGTEKRV